MSARKAPSSVPRSKVSSMWLNRARVIRNRTLPGGIITPGPERPHKAESRRGQMADVPWIISVDDHVIEPPHVWQERLPKKLRDRGPKVVRDSYTVEWVNGNQVFSM